MAGNEPDSRRRLESDDRRHVKVPSVAVTGSRDALSHIERLVGQGSRRREPFSLVRVVLDAILAEEMALDAEVERTLREDLARRLAGGIRATDRLVRDTDIHSCVLLPGAGLDCALRVAGRLDRNLNGVYRIDGRNLRVRVAIGWAVHPADGSRGEDLLRAAEPRRMN